MDEGQKLLALSAESKQLNEIIEEYKRVSHQTIAINNERLEIIRKIHEEQQLQSSDQEVRKRGLSASSVTTLQPVTI